MKILKRSTYKDERGSFQEAIHRPIVQVNRSVSHYRVLRGLHWQDPPQAKWVEVLDGTIFDVAVDVRPLSLHFGQYLSTHLSAEDNNLVYIPPGFAHGFLVMSESARVQYFCDVEYAPNGQRGIRWDDPKVNICWPFKGGIPEPILSEKDAALPYLSDLSWNDLPPYPER